jgi:segregation and condensation protein A
LRRSRSSTFRALTADCEGTLVVVARFLALLELYREGVVQFDQVSPLGELHIRWTGSDQGEVGVTDEFDVEPTEAAPAGETAVQDTADHDLGEHDLGEHVIDLTDRDETESPR